LLNLGHTFGHAIEKLSDYKIPHGVAVANGIYVILSAVEGSRRSRIMNVLQKNDMLIKHNYTTEQLINAALSDKKGEGNAITLVTINDIGDCVLKKVVLTKEFFS